ncbi:hypothetical protein BDA96_02G114600 [Sorghum bicolor]|uniref:Uncharacterized protein n=2 Tax=Sorghum bicolor TaxID=4558 RepID=A0A1B6QAI7_SORBI|nr:hypothetical protein BDA96_02G114600 [Sorghum bicolor]KXG34924.1 hypothetical protein SORBI_3002G109200 [Sorghum bicolor]KXG34925.1 hypothetical protein SORBI_3002G109200 [Sorghum bicolor]
MVQRASHEFAWEMPRADTVVISSQMKTGHPRSRSTPGAVEPIQPSCRTSLEAVIRAEKRHAMDELSYSLR